MKEQLQELYSTKSKYIEKGIQFVLAILTFFFINQDMGYMKTLANPVVTFGLAVICAFLPPVVTVWIAAFLILIHMAAISLGIMAVTACMFLLMFVFYLRFSPKMAIIVLLMPLAFMLKVPYVIPVACGLMAGVASIVPIVCGTIVYYMTDYVKTSAEALKGVGGQGMINQITAYAKQTFQNKEMLVTVIAFIICVFLVYAIHRMSANHAWKVAAASGAVVNIVMIAAGDIVLGIKPSYPELILGNAAAVAIGLILELLFFSVDYSRCESVQYEDDDYYYYVKAVPKIVVSKPEKTVKHINEREEDKKTEIINTEEIRKKASEKGTPLAEKEERSEDSQEKKSAKDVCAPKAAESRAVGNTEQLLLTRSLREELNLDKTEE